MLFKETYIHIYTELLNWCHWFIHPVNIQQTFKEFLKEQSLLIHL